MGVCSVNQAQQIVRTAQKYNNSADILRDSYGIGSDESFDAFVIAPAWLPEKILKDCEAEIECRLRKSYFSSYVVSFGGVRIAWLQCGSGAGNCIDTALALANSSVDKVIFVGAVGALKAEIPLGMLATPLESYAFEGGSMYLRGDFKAPGFGRTVRPHNPEFINAVVKTAGESGVTLAQKKVFCTESILCEYTHLDDILSTGAELIEMETAAFYECMRMQEKNGIALLCVSDNSAAGISLVARTEEETAHFHRCREQYLPELIRKICREL